MPRFRKKPVEIEARQFTGRGGPGSLVDLRSWGAPVVPIVGPGDALEVLTLEGRMMAQKGDWIIRGVKGEFYPCKPDVFEATYEPV